MDEFKKIRLIVMPDRELKIENPTNLELIGKGVQGAVFKISEIKCVKIYPNEELAEREAAVYKGSKGSKIIPKLYEVGKNYIIIEYLKAIPLDKYLLEKGYIEFDLTVKLLKLIKEMRNLGFQRSNPAVRHIYVSNNKTLKLIDHVGSYKRGPLVPIKLLLWMQKNKFLDDFFKQLREIDNDIYNKWKDNLTKYLKKKEKKL